MEDNEMKKIIVEELSYKYPLGERLSLNSVSLTIEEGEFIGIIGENLAGKTTLCQALVGLVPHFYHGGYKGKVEVAGMNTMKHSIAELSEKIGLVFQNPFNQISGAKLTVYEEIAFGLENLGVPRQEMIKRVDEALHLLDIEHLKEQNPFHLSGGQMQRVAIASIMALKPEIIVLDEPTSQLDPQGTDEVFKAAQRLSAQGTTVVMVEHKIEKIAAYAEKLILMSQGQVVDVASPQKLFSRLDLKELGVRAPIFTQVAQALELSENNDTLPVTLEDTYKRMVKKFG